MRKTSEELAAKTAKLKDQFRAYSREPFIDILAKLTACEPTQAALETFATNHPDRWIAAMAKLGQLAGYHERLEIKGNLVLELHSMGDAQLLAALAEVDEKLLELTVDPVGSDDEKEEADKTSPLLLDEASASDPDAPSEPSAAS